MSTPCKVLIIESRSSQDKEADRSEQSQMEATFKLLDIKAKFIEVSTAKGFYGAIKKANSEHINYVHFSGHGEVRGIAIGDNDFITWKDFDENCWPSLKNTCLSFSSCYVAKGVEELYYHHATFCSAIIAATREVKWSESAIAFSAFFLKATDSETSTDQDVRMMNHICGPGTFKFFQASSASGTKVLE